MGTFFLFFQANNFAETVYDSEDLSTIRGASLALHHMPEIFMNDAIVGGFRMIRFVDISSARLIEFEAESANALRTFARRWLDGTVETANSDDMGIVATLPDLSFSVGVVDVTGRFAKDYIDARNAAQDDRYRRLGTRSTATGSAARRALGQDARRGLLLKSLADIDLNGKRLSQSFEEISHKPNGKLPAKLMNKIAVLQFDADDLTSCFSLDSFASFKKDSDNYRDAMKSLLRKICAHFLAKKESSVQFEVLLWGGDEAVLVTPALDAFDLLDLINDEFKALREKDWSGKNKVTVSCAVTVCNRKTPIRTVKRLNDSMIADAKKRQRSLSPQNCVQYFLAGHMEMPVEGICRFRRRLFDMSEEQQRDVFTISLDALANLRSRLAEILATAHDPDSDFSITALHRLTGEIQRIRAWSRMLEPGDTCADLVEQTIDDMRIKTDPVRVRLKAVGAAVLNAVPVEAGSLAPWSAALHFQALVPFAGIVAEDA